MKINRKTLTHLAREYRVENGAKFHLQRAPTAPDKDRKLDDKSDQLLAESLKIMSDLQEKLYAQGQWSLLLIFQAMDAAGKDGTIKHVMSGINPQGCRVTSFKAPSTLEQNHDFLWRSAVALPERGQIGIFNRSYYEETLVTRVHRDVLHQERLAPSLFGKHLWRERFEDIKGFERHLLRNGTVIRKFFLHLSRAEQKRRFLSRLDEPSKNWKFSAADLKERGFWDDYQSAYEKTIRATATSDAPWYVVPADDKKYAHLVVAGAVIDAMESMKLAFPKVSAPGLKALAAARAELEK